MKFLMEGYWDGKSSATLDFEKGQYQYHWSGDSGQGIKPDHEWFEFNPMKAEDYAVVGLETTQGGSSSTWAFVVRRGEKIAEFESREKLEEVYGELKGRLPMTSIKRSEAHIVMNPPF